MKNNNPEQLIKNEILEWLLSQGALAWPTHSVGIYDPVKKIFRKNMAKFHILGVSDILGIWKTHPLAIEVKSSVGRATTAQLQFIEKFNSQGGIAFIARSLDEVKAYLD